jgi:type IV fimbrial biogenesis protein FimT
MDIRSTTSGTAMNRIAKPAHRRAQNGVSLIESSIVLCLMALATGAVAPSFERAQQRRHLEGSAAQVATDLQYARSLAVARAATVRVSFQTHAGASCYVVHTGSAGDCQCASGSATVCRNGAEAVHAVRFEAGASVQVSSKSASMVFDPIKGTVTPTGTGKIQARHGSAIHQVVNVMGRVRTCSPAPALPGYRAC